MTFARWLLVHSLSICILIMLIIGYFFKDELKLNQAYHQLLNLEPDSIVAQVENNLNKPNTKVYEPKKRAISSQASNAEATQSTHSDFAKTTQQPANESKVEAHNTTLNTKTTFDNTHLQVNPEPVFKDDKPTKSFLYLAREAYWQKEYQKSLNFYKQAIEKEPSSADLYGEVGNVHFGLKQLAPASNFYLMAGELFLKTGQDDRAKEVYDILASISPEKAEKLLAIKRSKTNPR